MAKVCQAWIYNLFENVFRGATYWNGYGGGYFPAQGTAHLCLLTAEPAASGVVDSLIPVENEFGEAVYTGYARQALTTSLAAMRGTQETTEAAVSSGTSGRTTLTAPKYFPLCTTSTQIITHVGLANSATKTIYADWGYIALLYAFWTLDTPIQLQNAAPGFYPVVPSVPDLFNFRIGDSS